MKDKLKSNLKFWLDLKKTKHYEKFKKSINAHIAFYSDWLFKNMENRYVS